MKKRRPFHIIFFMNIVRIQNLNIPELEIYVGTNEVGLLHYYEPDVGIFVAESPNVTMRALAAGYEPLSFLMEEKYLTDDYIKIIEDYDVPVYVGELDVIKNITGYPMTRGMLCAMRRKPLPDMAEITRDAKSIVVLEKVMNPTNVGAIFRSAAALGMDAVLLTPECADPYYRRASRVSMGAVFQIPWTYVWDRRYKVPDNYIESVRSLGFKTVSMALLDNSVSIKDPVLLAQEKLAVVMGTESEGLMDYTISHSDYVVKIPMYHGVDSLNVGSAAAVSFYEIGSRQIKD